MKSSRHRCTEKSAHVRNVAHRVVALAVVIAFLSGCLSNSFRIRQDELVRLAEIPPDQRWQAVRAVQHVHGRDTPPDEFPPPASIESRAARANAVATVVADSASVARAGVPPPLSLRPPGVPPPPFLGAGNSGGGSGSGGGSSGGSGGLGGGDSAALLVALVVGAIVVVAVLVPTEGLRYDGWIAVSPDERLYLRTQNGDRLTVPLSQLTPDIAQVASSADVYEGTEPRFGRRGRAPLDRTNFGMSAQFLATDVPQLDRTRAIGLGAHVNLSWNFVNMVSVGASIDASASSPAAGGSTLFANVGPEVMVLPCPWFGGYVGGGWAYRNAWSGTGSETRNGGYYLRAGLIGEIPITTRLSLQGRTGAARIDVGDGIAPFTWEASLGVAVY